MEPQQVRVREVVASLHAIDGDSLLTAPMLERIVTAVLQALDAGRMDARRRHDDIRVPGVAIDEAT